MRIIDVFTRLIRKLNAPFSIEIYNIDDTSYSNFHYNEMLTVNKKKCEL